MVNALTTKVGKEADAILTLNAKTTETVLDRLQSVIEVIKQSKSTEDIKVLSDYATKLKQQGELVKQYATALQSDIAKDKSAQDVVRTANIKVQALLDAAENQAELTKHAILTGDSAQPSYIEQSIVDVKSAILAIGDATKTIADLAVDKIKISDTKKIVEKTTVDEEVVKSSVDTPTDAHVKDDNTPSATKSEPKAETKEINSEQKIETKTADQKEDPKEVEAKSETPEPMTDQKLENADSDHLKEFKDEDTPKERLLQSKSEVELNSPGQKVEKKDAESNASDKNVDLSSKEHTTSANIDQPRESPDHLETSTQIHSEMASDAHGIIESAQVASLDTGDHFSAIDVGHELASTAVVSAGDIHNLASIIADSLWL